MDDDVRRLEVLIESNTVALEELRRLDDPGVTKLIQELEQARAEAVAQLAKLRAEHARQEPEEPG